MTASELKANIEAAGHESHFFDRDTMRFFGDRMSNYGVRSAVVRSQYNGAGEWVGHDGAEIEVWELWRRRAVKCGLRSSAYFDKITFRLVFPEVEG
jgi:hypothetical protein